MKAADIDRVRSGDESRAIGVGASLLGNKAIVDQMQII
jgi:hypothetical protein